MVKTATGQAIKCDMSEIRFRPRAIFAGFKALPLFAYARNSLFQALVIGPDYVRIRLIRQHTFRFADLESIGYRSFLGHHVKLVPRRGASIFSASFRRAEDAIAVITELHRRGAPLDQSALEFARLPAGR
jgi:hypothetical protein